LTREVWIPSESEVVLKPIDTFLIEVERGIGQVAAGGGKDWEPSVS